MSLERLPAHRFRPVRLVAAVAFAVLGVVVLTDTSLDRGLGWLWGSALVMVGVVGLVAIVDRARTADE